MLRKFITYNFKKPAGLLGRWASGKMIKGNEDKYERLIADLAVQPHDKMLKIGYGPGRGINTIAGRYPTCIIHGIDFSKLMYKEALSYNKTYVDAGRVQLQFGDFLTTPSLSSNYDKVFCLNVIYFWDELKTPFEKVYSLLKQEGAFHIYMADKNTLIKMKTPDSVFNKYSVDQVTEALTGAGFATVDHYTDKGHYIKATK